MKGAFRITRLTYKIHCTINNGYPMKPIFENYEPSFATYLFWWDLGGYDHTWYLAELLRTKHGNYKTCKRNSLSL